MQRQRATQLQLLISDKQHSHRHIDTHTQAIANCIPQNSTTEITPAIHHLHPLTYIPSSHFPLFLCLCLSPSSLITTEHITDQSVSLLAFTRHYINHIPLPLLSPQLSPIPSLSQLPFPILPYNFNYFLHIPTINHGFRTSIFL